MPPTITMDHSDYGNVTYCADWRDRARLDSLHEVPMKGAAMKKTGIALAALLCFVSMPPAASADPSFYLGYTGKKWAKDYGVIAGTCDAGCRRGEGEWALRIYPQKASSPSSLPFPADLSLLYQHFFRLRSNYWKFKRLRGIIDVGEEKGRRASATKDAWPLSHPGGAGSGCYGGSLPRGRSRPRARGRAEDSAAGPAGGRDRRGPHPLPARSALRGPPQPPEHRDDFRGRPRGRHGLHRDGVAARTLAAPDARIDRKSTRLNSSH